MITKFIAGQFKKPSGLAGRLWGRFMNYGNARIIAGSINALEAESRDRILEIGFGGGFGLHLLLARVMNGSVTGTEISNVMRAHAEKHFTKAVAENRLSLFSAPVEQLPFNNSSFDRIVTVNTIYFWSDVRRGISEIFRVLRPGGRLVIGIRPAEVMRRLPFTKHGFSIYETDEIEKLLGQAGFTGIRSERYEDGRLGYVCALAHKPLLAGQGS